MEIVVMDNKTQEPMILRDRCELNFNPSYSIISSFISFFVPCFIMLLIYYHVYNFARYHMECIKEQNRPLLRLQCISLQQQQNQVVNNKVADAGVSSAPANSVENHNNQSIAISNQVQAIEHEMMANNNSKKQQGRKVKRKKKSKLVHPDSPLIQEHKAAITIGIIMGVFLLCWTPFFIVNVISGICKECIPPTVFSVLTWLGYSNSAFNPIIYSIFNTEFREAFHKILTQRFLFCRKRAQFPFDVWVINNKTSVSSNDPLSQIHSPASSSHCSSLNVLLREILKSGYGDTHVQTTRAKIVITTGRECGSASWIN